MILQTFIMQDEACTDSRLFYRNEGEVQARDGKITLQAGACMDSYSYMNLFDLDAWEKYTDIREKKLLLRIRGRGKIKLVCQSGQKTKKISAVSYDCMEQEGQRLQIEIPDEVRNGKIYFEVEADTQTCLYRAAYATRERARREVYLALVICTYHRKEQLERNIRRIRESGFYTDKDLKGRLMVRIVDNGQELKDEYGEGIRVYGNPNTGGSGGFSRGMEETVKEKGSFPATQVILMDDDVEFMAESLYRLYALLSYEREEYRQIPVAGRMFRLDQRQVQYTAAEIWNRGDIRHIGWNRDMTQPENLTDINENKGAEYGGWWFACYPMEFVEKNRPLPFFLHCDDVEYGLRHGGTPIILNGIQVWHETYEYRQSAVMAYYDTRNALIVNAIYVPNQKKDIVIDIWKENIQERFQEDKEEAYARMLGIFHFYSGRFGSLKRRRFKWNGFYKIKFWLMYKTVFVSWPYLFELILKKYAKVRKRSCS